MRGRSRHLLLLGVGLLHCSASPEAGSSSSARTAGEPATERSPFPWVDNDEATIHETSPPHGTPVAAGPMTTRMQALGDAFHDAHGFAAAGAPPVFAQPWSEVRAAAIAAIGSARPSSAGARRPLAFEPAAVFDRF